MDFGHNINGSLLRVRFYLFDEGASGVELGVHRYFEQTPLLGLCQRPQGERVIDFSNINPFSCDLQLAWQENLYQGNNAPNGCPSTFPPGGKVVSYLNLGENDIYSLDQIFNANGGLEAGTPIQFRRVTIPEPSLLDGLILFGVSSILIKKVS
ncbi:CpcT/CpeT family chromophore lyase [Gloeothece verrucosa]|uniref:PEP-CTERM sorting domain-containing protein n=1 Tax=Gloeothece verrucosa (strain PCC 7822) TaxID=497965 RepID=E0ULL2_GLOV7|nr:CpcT/CpeT family chromophore lyase [Gloeothece verrucosa]ADN17842.1 conserved hypothetical protein [Gloeothece verrucosa PCC 7822]